MALNVELLESSFDKVKPRGMEFVSSFYDNLLTAHPEAKPLFAHTSMKDQQKKLLDSLVLVIENVRTPDALVNPLRGLGARHVNYGALPEHYPMVGGALLRTFETYLGPDWTPDVKDAWVEAYQTITQIMLDGADYPPEILNVGESAASPVAAPSTITVPERTEGLSAVLAATVGFIVLGGLLMLL